MVNIIWGIVLLIALLFGAMCGIVLYCRKLTERYIKLEEWAENWLKRLEQKVEHAELRMEFVNDMQGKVCERLNKLEELMPKDGDNEVIRNRAILRQMNDEMERGLKMEREWNDGLSSILNYGKPITEVNKNE